MGFGQYLSDVIDWVVQHQDELVTKFVLGGVTVIAAFLNKIVKMPFLILWNMLQRFRRKDEFATIYGKWYCYRLNRHTRSQPLQLLDTWIIIRRSLATRYPKCELYSRHMAGTEEPTIVDGEARFSGGNLVIMLSDRARQKGHPFKGPSVMHLKHEGSPIFSNFKVGMMSGVASGGDIVAGAVLWSRASLLDLDTKEPLVDITAYIDPFSRVTVASARATAAKLEKDLAVMSE